MEVVEEPEVDHRAFVCDGNEVTNIWFLYTKEDFSSTEKTCYKPALCHQVYNTNETIFGYRDLIINIYYNAKTMECYVEYNYSAKIKEDPTLGIKADDIMAMLTPWLPNDYFSDKDYFLYRMTNAENRMFGTVKANFQLELPKWNTSEFYVTHISGTEQGFKKVHDQFQRVIVWYIDAASLIDLDDPKWNFFYVYESRSGEYYPVGFCTVYQFYKHPYKIRARISQFFVLPSHQRIGLGSKLLEAVYKTLWEQEEVSDITVEDPSVEFRRLRDLMDCKILKDLPEFAETFVLANPFSRIVAVSATMSFKIYSEQARRVHEILNLYYARTDNMLLREWCIRVKKRLKIPIEKEPLLTRRGALRHPNKKALDEGIDCSSTIDLINRMFKDYVEEIFPTLQKLHVLYGNEVVKGYKDLKRLWDRI